MQRAWVLIVLTAIILAFALATGLPMFYRTVYVFGLLLIFGFLWVWFLGRGIDLAIRRPILRTRAGSEISEQVIVGRRQRLLRGFIEIQEHTDMPAPDPGAVVSLSGADTVIDLEVPCPRRGVFQIGPVGVSGSDPLGLFRLRRSFGEAQRLIVHPATVELPGFILLPAELPGEGRRHLRSPNVTTSAFGIRDYVFGDSLNRMSWKATAHHNKLMVKEFEIEPANNIWLLADMERRAHTVPGEQGTEETVVSVAASICKRYLDANFPVGFMSYGNERFLIPAKRGSAQLQNILDALAELKAHGNAPLLDLIGDLHTKAGRYTSVAIVTPSPDPAWLAGMRHLLERRARVTVIVVDGDLSNKDYPDSAYSAAALGVPTYTVKRGALGTAGLLPLTAGAHPQGHRRAMAGLT